MKRKLFHNQYYMGDICPAPDLPSGISEQERTLLTCKSSVQCLSNVVNSNKKSIEENQKILSIFEKDLSAYKEEKRIYLETLNRYEKRTGEFAEYALRDGVSRDFWAKDHDGTCWWGENWGGANEWCNRVASDKGYNGGEYYAREWGWCNGRYGNFKCAKSPEVVKKEQDDYTNAKPMFNKQEPKHSDYALKQIIPVESVAINCCFNYMNVTGSAESNIQTCNQIIEQKLNTSDAPVAPQSPTSINTPVIPLPVVPVTKQPDPSIYPKENLIKQAPSKVENVTNNRQRITLGLVISIILIIIFCSSALLLVT